MKKCSDSSFWCFILRFYFMCLIMQFFFEWSATIAISLVCVIRSYGVRLACKNLGERWTSVWNTNKRIRLWFHYFDFIFKWVLDWFVPQKFLITSFWNLKKKWYCVQNRWVDHGSKQQQKYICQYFLSDCPVLLYNKNCATVTTLRHTCFVNW